MALNAIADFHAPDMTATAQQPLRVRFYDRFEALPPSYDVLFEQSGRQSVCLTRAWFENLAGNILCPDERLCLVGVETSTSDPAALALLVGRHRDRDRTAGGARSFTSLSNYYSMVFAPLVAAGADPVRVLGMLVQAIRDTQPRYDALRFQPLDRASPLFGALHDALRGAGLVVQPYFHCGNWYERTAGATSAAYLARRPAELRNTIRRKGAKLAGRGVRLEVITDAWDLERGLADYESVYGRSWKDPEPGPRVIRDLARACAAEGALRLGILHLDGAPIAAQIWIVWEGKATLYKLAHDRRHDRLSPGTVLTMHMIERVIDVDRAAEVDFGVGDDPYKRRWASARRERWGLVAFEPRTVRGKIGILRHVVGRGVKAALANGLSGQRGRPPADAADR